MDQIVEINRHRIFSLVEAHSLLTLIYRLTEESSREVKRLVHVLETLPDKKSPRAQEVEAQIDGIVARWQKKVEKLGAVPKGLWLADFDNGEGYYCWKFPETQIRHWHGYQDGFSNRKIIPDIAGMDT